MDKQLIDIVQEYIRNKNDISAIMINGDWGSGKTYFIKHKLKNKVENLIYVSLYGIRTTEELNEKMCYAILNTETKDGFFRKFLEIKLIEKIWNFIVKWFNKLKALIYKITNQACKLKFGVDLSEFKKKDFMGIIDQSEKIKDYVIVLDDIERCSIDIEELMGYINNLVEHKKVKMILVANEREIKRNIYDNYELKLISSMSANIKFPEQKNNEDLSREMVKERIKYLYEENDKYKKTKEKIVSKTYDYIPNLDEVLEHYINCSDIRIRKYLKNNKDEILNVMNINNCKNLRTLNVALKYYQDIISKIEKHVTNEYRLKKDLIYKVVLINVLFVAIAQKSGVNIPNILSGNLGTTVSIEKGLKSKEKYFYAFSFVNNYIETGFFDNDLMERALKHYEDLNSTHMDEGDPFNIIDVYWEQESEKLKVALNDLKGNLEKDIYNCKLYPKLLIKLSSLLALNFEKEKIYEIIRIMEDNIIKNKINYLDFRAFLEDDDSISIYNTIIDEFKEKININNDNESKNRYESILDSENWGESLLNFVDKNKGEFINQKEFVGKLNVKKIIDKLKIADNYNIFCFKYALDKVYDFSNLNEYYKLDLENLDYLIKEIEKIKNCDDIMRKHALSYLNEVLKKKKDIIEIE